jgi:multidrug efflux pump subunit AcrA (membrane-fusion protein)
MKQLLRRSLLVLASATAGGACVLGAWPESGLAALLGGPAAIEPLTVPVRRERFVRMVLAEGYLRAVKAAPITSPIDVPGSQRVAWLAENGALVRQGDVVLRLDAEPMRRELADGRTDLAIAEAKIAGAQARTETQKRALLLDAEQAEREQEQQTRFARRDERIYSRNDLLESQIDRELAQERASNARGRSTIVAQQGRTEIELLQIEKAKAELQIRQAERGLAALTVLAPHHGMLVLERNWRGETARVGGDVWPGQKLAEIPDPSQMQAQCYVLEADAAGLAAGCAASLIVEAWPHRRFPARVASVDALAKKRHEQVPVQYFEVLVLPETTDREVMKPGQRVRAEIVLESLDSAMSVPRQAIVEREGKTLVYRRSGGAFEPAEVKLGAHGLAHAVVVSGLEEGDEVALGEPGGSRPEKKP